MAGTVKASVILEGISVRSPGVGSNWEFTFWVDGTEQPSFRRDIKDGQTASFRKTLFAKDVPAKQPKSVAIQVAVQEKDEKTSDNGNGGTTISIDTTSGAKVKESFQAQVTERGGWKAGAVATLTFDLVAEVRGDAAACEECNAELQDAARVRDEFETAAAELLAMLIPGTLASDFALTFRAYDTARVGYELARGAWDAAARQVRDCSGQNPGQSKARCLQSIGRVEKYNDELNVIGLDLIPLLNTRADYMGRRYMAYLAADRIDLDIALYEAQIEAACLDDLDSVRAQLNAAKARKDDADDTVSKTFVIEQQAEREAKKKFDRLLKAMSLRDKALLTLQDCAGNQGFGSCGAAAQALLVKDAQLGSALTQQQAAYQDVDVLLVRYNSQLNQLDDRNELLVENYVASLKEYTSCVARLDA